MFSLLTITLLTMNYRKVNNHVAESLSLKEAHTYFGLLMKSDFNTGISYVKEETLADYLGIARSTVSEHIRKMEKEGLIEIETKMFNGHNGKIHKSNTYKMIYDGDDSPCHWVLIDERIL